MVGMCNPNPNPNPNPKAPWWECATQNVEEGTEGLLVEVFLTLTSTLNLATTLNNPY